MTRLLLAALCTGAGSAVGPVVIVPGDGSNQLEAKADKPSTVSWRCSKKYGWSRLWLDTSRLLVNTDCWADDIKLLYDEEKDVLSNNIGVETRVPDFGGTSAFEELDPSVPFQETAVFYKMVQQMVAAGLERNVTLRGAPYDFRYAPSSPVGARYIDSLRDLIEQTVNATGKRISIVSHSMGCLQTLYLLNNQPQLWKDQYVEKWIPLNGPYGGAVKELRLHASGDSQGISTVNPLTIREEQRSYETNFWLAPMPSTFGNQTLVSTPSRNYSAQDYEAFFNDIGFSAGSKLFKRVESLTSAAVAPGVDVVCMYSLGVDTPSHLKYDKQGFDKQPTTTNGDGDGTVNAVSLELCDAWAQQGAQARSAKVVRFSGITHSGMLSEDGVVKAVMNELGLTTTQPAGMVV